MQQLIKKLCLFLIWIPKQRLEGRELYQALYDDFLLHYGDARHERSPAVRYLPHYEGWLLPPVIDLGCGRGQNVDILRKKGLDIDGIDQVRLNNRMMVGNITNLLPMDRYNTTLCIDVFEHLTDNELKGLVNNMKKTRRQVVSVYCAPAREYPCKNNLHVNIKPVEQWQDFLSRDFVIKKTITLQEGMRYLFLTESKF